MTTDRNNDIEESASGWLIRRDSDSWTDADQARFEEWLDASTLNRITFLRLELAWEESARLKALGAGVPGDRPPPPGEWNLTAFFYSHRRPAQDGGAHSVANDGWTQQDSADTATFFRRALRSSRHFAIAAGLFLAVAIGLGVYQLQREGEHFATPVGGLTSVPMIDGSQITLNTDSQVRVRLTRTERRIELKRGEAFFEVAKDHDRPFIVDVDGRHVVAVGTKFSVRRDGNALEVTVTEGVVKLDDTILTVGMIARSREDGLLVQRKSLAEAELNLSWRRGVLMLREMPLSHAVAEFNRYNVRKLVVADPEVGALKVEGNFRPTNVLAFVRLLESGFPIRASVEDEQIVLNAR
ncbi:FecR family protein [Povalibacter sp.]|uniref:FecR family protein n=1 Tax=Povalibacter sp. TaxID=1962978 RepID=UPI002F4060B5